MRSVVALIVLCLAVAVQAQDPASSWLSYASFDAKGQPITYLNATWKVPSMPSSLYGSNAPGWWFGVQTANGAGALIQPILAFADGSPVYTIFNGVFDWNDESWYQSEDSQVNPGDTIFASVSLGANNVYTMYIASLESGWSVTSTKVVKQGQVESVAYFVLEHQPDSCSAYPSNGSMSFESINVEVNGKAVSPKWTSHIGVNACNSAAKVVSPSQIDFTWDTQDLNNQESKPHQTHHFFKN